MNKSVDIERKVSRLSADWAMRRFFVSEVFATPASETFEFAVAISVGAATVAC
ncbi:hypothetical protein QRB32_09455 [Mycobacterium intracellulare subsp. chimaera]|uniref:hypothetical protein n=1 Tax=Mycobacterium intracellulare TaxID=1767 RepID=UPI00259B6A55|nr:hypothetical protein [Mycobacterium intracellulare]MDM3932425.1 hypothetical protein [Mycobacterium intracellulare subsp. chimaera]